MRRRKNSNNIAPGFDKTNYVEKELIDKITLWMLRIVVKLGGYRELITTQGNCNNYDVAFLGLTEVLDSSKVVPMDVLKINLAKLEQQNKLTGSKIFATKNLW